MRNGVSYEREDLAVRTQECKWPGCGKRIFLASVRRHDGEVRRVPIDADPTPDGNVVFDGLCGHYLVKGEQPPAVRYTSHHKTCKGEREQSEGGRA